MLIMTICGVLGYMLMQDAIIVLSNPPYYRIDPIALGSGAAVLAIGGFLSGLIMYASLVKYTVEESIREVENVTLPQTSTRPLEKACPNCGKLVPINAEYCVYCGAKLT